MTRASGPIPAAEREIVVIDDGSVEPVGGLPGDVEIVRNPAACGVSQARRLGCSFSAGDVTVCLDAHMTFRGRVAGSHAGPRRVGGAALPGLLYL